MNKFVSPLLLAFCLTAHGHRLPFEKSDFDYPINEHLDAALIKAGPNRDNLFKALEHYHQSGDQEKFRAACFLIENMHPHSFVRFGVFAKDKEEVQFNALEHESLDAARERLDELSDKHGELDFGKSTQQRDLETISTELLIENIDLAFQTWRTKPWLKKMSFETFCEYILPHRSSSEPLEGWRKKIIERSAPFAADIKTDNYDEAVAKIQENVKKWVHFKNIYYMHPTDQSYSEMAESSLGRCEDISNMHNFAMRANGVASASDYTPYWARGSNNHAWKVILNDQGIGVGGLKIAGKAAKVYRKMYSVQRDSLYFQNEKKESLPRWLQGQTYRDVTTQYMKTYDVEVALQIPVPDETDFVYLCVFNSGAWKPIHWTKATSNKVTFTEMGPNIAYLPAYFVKDKMIAAATPVLLKNDGTTQTLHTNGEVITLVPFTHTKPQRYDVDRLIINEKERIVEGDDYVVKEWKNGKWTEFSAFTAEKDTLDLINLHTHTLYWVVKNDSRKLERIFSIDEDGTVAWW